MSMKMKKLPIGVSDFKYMIRDEYYYIDKTLFIKDVLDKGDRILLIPRPRRFGKTLNLSMLKYFYDCCPQEGERETGADNSYKKLFQSLAISRAGKEYLDKMGKYPVIFLTFKNIKEMKWETCLFKIKQLIQEEYSRHDYLLESPKMKPHERDYFQKIMNLSGHMGDYENSLEKLLIFLNRYYRQRAVILIDEYDAPVHAGFNEGYYKDVIGFIRNFLCGGLKDTDQYLEKGILTGIMRIAQESIFSGLNNPGVYTLLSEAFNDKFGFTEKEVETILCEFGVINRYEQVQEWYNGYRFGETVIYNPWSIVNFLAEGAKKFKSYWVNTADNEIVESLLSGGGKELKQELEVLIRGESIEKVIEEHIVLKNIPDRENLLWSFLLMGGYLKQTEARLDRFTGKMHYTLSIPNKEVKTKLGFIIEFKKTRKKETLETAVKSALKQIENQKYETELLQRGIKNYKKLAIVFKGKEVTVKEG